MKKITILALHLGYGGIEKAIASFCNMLCNEYEINIICTYKLYNTPPFEIDERVKITYLAVDKPNRKEVLDSLKSANVISLFKEGFKSIKILYLRRNKMIEAIKNIDSDIIISTRPFHNRLLSQYGKEDAIKIAWEHSHHNDNQKYVTELLESIKNIDYLIPVSTELTEYYKKLVTGKTKCLHISLALDNIPKTRSTLENKEITIIGKLSREKGMVDLIDVFSIVHKNQPDWHLNIVGDGPEKKSILNKIVDSNLGKSITTYGFKNKDEVDDILINTSIYMMTSYTESFGLVLLEAMAYGIPCVAFDSAQGAREIIENKVDGYLITNRDKEAMANQIIDLIKDEDLRQKIGKKAKQKAILYSTKNIRQEWINLLENKSSN
ncbi:MAG: glycosyltransferase [Bacilli bacterium]|nr:glycosyltransferase [Bacilli bacterium]